MKCRILFVDDERNILQGLKRTFHDMHRVWDMRFATNGQEALELLGKEPADVILTDILMPEMDGIELLDRVKNAFPQTIRIILSADMDLKTSLQTVRQAHQFINKPSDVGLLKLTIERACCLNRLLTHETLKRQLTRLETLPALPDLYRQVVDALANPDCTIQDVAKIIEKDIGMATKLLQLVNSSFFGFARHVTIPSEAVVLLGIDIVRVLVLTIGLFTEFRQSGVSERIIEAVYNHSIETGKLARDIALSASLPKKHADDAFMAGLLHDLGKLVIVYNMPEQYGNLLEASLSSNVAIEDEGRETVWREPCTDRRLSYRVMGVLIRHRGSCGVSSCTRSISIQHIRCPGRRSCEQRPYSSTVGYKCAGKTDNGTRPELLGKDWHGGPDPEMAGAIREGK